MSAKKEITIADTTTAPAIISKYSNAACPFSSIQIIQ